MDEEEIPERLTSPPLLEPCPCCGRSFVHETLVKHQKICEKNASKQRKVFDTSKKRLSGLGVDQVTKAPSPPPSKKNNWRRKHEEFQEAMKSARQVSHALKTGAPLPPPISQKPKVNPDYVQCPSCSRNFNETAAERHIPWCKEQSKKIGNKGPAADKKNQLNTRTKYKPPLPGAKKLKSPIARTGMGRTNSQPPMRDNLDDSPSEVMSAGRRRSIPQKQGKTTSIVGPKARSSSLERPIGRKPPRNNSGDSLRRRNLSEDEYDYSSPGEDNGHDSSLSNGYYRNSPVLPHHKLKAVNIDSCSCSLWSVAAISVNRFVAICHRIHYPRIYNRYTMMLIIPSMWTICFCIDLPNLLGWGAHAFDARIMLCTYDYMKSYSYTIFFVICGFLIPLVAVIFSYSKIFLYAQGIKRDMEKVTKQDGRKGVRNGIKDADRKLLRSVMTIMVVFFTMWAPYSAVVFLDFQGAWPRALYVFTVVLAHLNSCINSILYAATNKLFRRGYHRVIQLTCCLICYQLNIFQKSEKVVHNSHTENPETVSHHVSQIDAMQSSPHKNGK